MLGTAADFRRSFQNPILTGREPDASPQEKDLALVRQNEMSLIVNQFILRRMNTINAQHLPDKLVQVSASRIRWQYFRRSSIVCILASRVEPAVPVPLTIAYAVPYFQVVCCKLTPLQTDLTDVSSPGLFSFLDR